jgi:hypothetical protein
MSPRTQQRIRRAATILVIVALLASCYPVQSVTAPEWKVRFIDKKGRPFWGMPVRQIWKDSSAQSSSSEQTENTDSNGSVTFPERRLRAPLIAHLIQPVANVFSAGVHASFGTSSYLIPLCDVMETGSVSAVYTGSELPLEIILSYFDRTPIRAATGGKNPSECLSIEAQAKDADA